MATLPHMASWPLARHVDFIPNSLPVISADALNALQDFIVALCKGEVSLCSVTVDGSGGKSATPLEGGISLTRRVFGSYLTGSSSPSVDLTEVHLGRLLAAWAVVYASGKLARAVNIKSIQRTGVGVYVVECHVRLDSDKTYLYPVWVTPRSGIAPQAISATYRELSSNPSKVEVFLWDKAGNAVDADFTVVLGGL